MTFDHIEAEVFRALFDCDGIFLDFSALYLAVVKEQLGLSFTLDDVTEWDVGDALGLTQAQKDLVHAELDKPGMGLKIPVIPEAVKAIKKVMKSCDVYFVTSPMKTNPTWASDRTKIITELFGKEYGDRVVSTSKKGLIHGHFLLDDKPKNIDEWREEWPFGIALLWDLPCNRKARGNYMRAPDWETVHRMIDIGRGSAYSKLPNDLTVGGK